MWHYLEANLITEFLRNWFCLAWRKCFYHYYLFNVSSRPTARESMPGRLLHMVKWVIRVNMATTSQLLLLFLPKDRWRPSLYAWKQRIQFIRDPTDRQQVLLIVAAESMTALIVTAQFWPRPNVIGGRRDVRPLEYVEHSLRLIFLVADRNINPRFINQAVILYSSHRAPIWVSGRTVTISDLRYWRCLLLANVW